MAVRKFQIILHADTALPRDSAVNTLYFEVNDPDTIEGTCDGIQACYASIGGIFSMDLTGVLEAKVYELAGGQPIFQKKYPAFPVGGAASPAEMALCLSYAAEDDPTTATRRRMGRIYLGPLSGAQYPRPNATQRDLVLDFGEALAQVGVAGNTTWVMYSRMDNATPKIESIWVDDAWDVQRRRGLAPTLREVRDVQ